VTDRVWLTAWQARGVRGAAGRARGVARAEEGLRERDQPRDQPARPALISRQTDSQPAAAAEPRYFRPCGMPGCTWVLLTVRKRQARRRRRGGSASRWAGVGRRRRV
jgi:hypothetical protein